jgi:hypothetical protein
VPSRFNPPSGWPPAPCAWTPPPGGQPNPSWPRPPGRLLWVEDMPAAAATGSPWPVWCTGGGAAVARGSLLPFIPNTSILDNATVNINGGGRGISGIFGAIMVALGVFAHRRLASGTCRPGTPAGLAVPLAVLFGLGALGHGGFAVVGLVGFQDQEDLDFPVRVTYSPSIGLVLSVLGCVLAAAGAIGMLRAATASRRRGG